MTGVDGTAAGSSCTGAACGGGGEEVVRADPRARTSTDSTSGNPASAFRTSSSGLSLASEAEMDAPPRCDMSWAGSGSISISDPSALSLRWMMRARAPGAAHDFISTTEISSRGSAGSTAATTGSTGLFDGAGGAEGSGSAWTACESLRRAPGALELPREDRPPRG